MSLLALVDGDVLAYHSCKPRRDQRSIKAGVNIVRLDDSGAKIEREFSKDEDAKYMEECWDNFKKDLNIMLEELFVDDFLMAVKGNGNYRYDLYPEYKAPRHKAQVKKPNDFVPALRQLAIMEDLAVGSDGREADDMLRIWSNEAKVRGDEVIICSVDKDLLCIPGYHWNMKHKVMVEVSEAEATRHYYEQLLKGDPTDNIPGVLGIGDVKARKKLLPFKTEEEFQEVVIETYMEIYGETLWENMLLSNGKMIHLQNHINDYFNFSQWAIVQDLRKMGRASEPLETKIETPKVESPVKAKIDPSKIKIKF